jgi:hypothetical protein
MVLPPTEAVLAELDTALDANTGQLGEVFRLVRNGAHDNREIVELGGAANEGAVWNLRRGLTAIREASLPTAPTVARQCASRTRSLLMTPSLSAEAIKYLSGLVEALEALTFDEEAQAQEVAELEDKSQKLEASIGDLAGIYVWSLPTFQRVPQKVDPDRYWFKIGKTVRSADGRIVEQVRQTGLPEDYVLFRVYVPPSGNVQEAEALFHSTLVEFGHTRAKGKYAGREWFATTLEALDRLAANQGYEIKKADG